MKFEARRDGMMRKGISDVDSVLTVRELVRLIKLYGIDVSSIEPEPLDEPLSGRSSTAALTEISGGTAEAVIRSLYYLRLNKEADKQIFKKFRSGGSFREATVMIGDTEVSTAIVDGLEGFEKLKVAGISGKKYNLVEVMACPGGCVNGAGLPFTGSRDEKRNRAKAIYQADETDAVNLPVKSPVLLNLMGNIIKGNKEIADKKIFYTQFQKRNVLL